MDKKESMEDYLEAILIIKEKKGFVRNIDIAHQLEYSKPSVTIALKKLKEEGLIDIDDENHINLLPRGEKIANDTYSRHKSITMILTSLGVDKEIAEKDACRIEHVISEQSFNALINHAKKMLTKV